MFEKRIGELNRRLEKLRAEKHALREKIADLKREHRNTVKDLREGWRLLEALPGGVVLIQGGKVMFMNETAREALGYEEDETKGHGFAEFVHPEFRAELLERYKKRVSGKPVPDRYETCLITRSGQMLWCDVRVKKLLLSGRRAFLLNLSGLNERKEREKRFAAIQKQKTLTRMSRGVHHEMEELLALVEEEYSNRGGPVESLLGGGSGNAPKRIQDILEAGHSLVRNLDLLGRTPMADEEGIPYDLRKVVQKVVSSSRDRWCVAPEGDGIQIKSYLRTLPAVTGKPEEIEYALSALVKNAIESLGDGGTIYLTTEASEGFAHVYIQDSGRGVPSDLRDKIYDPYFTTKGEARRGLGLSLARAIVRRNGGSIDLQGAEGNGTTCTLRFPLPAQSPRQTLAATRKRMKGMRILVVSSQDILRELLCRFFSGKGCQVDAAVTGGEAFRLVPRKGYGLLVVDTEDTEKGTLLRVFRQARQVHPETPIVLIHNPDELGVTEAVKTRYGDLLIQKPLDMDRVQAKVVELLAQKG